MRIRLPLLMSVIACGLTVCCADEPVEPVSQVLVYKVRQKALLNFHRLSSSTWESRALPATAFLVLEVSGSGTIDAARILSTWSAGAEKLYQVTDPTTENLSLLRLGGVHRTLIWNTASRKAICYGAAPSSTVVLANAYAGTSTAVVEEPYAGATRVAAVTAATLALRLDKVMSVQANIVHDVPAFVQVLVTGLQGKGYTDADAPAP